MLCISLFLSLLHVWFFFIYTICCFYSFRNILNMQLCNDYEMRALLLPAPFAVDHLQPQLLVECFGANCYKREIAKSCLFGPFFSRLLSDNLELRKRKLSLSLSLSHSRMVWRILHLAKHNTMRKQLTIHLAIGQKCKLLLSSSSSIFHLCSINKHENKQGNYYYSHCFCPFPRETEKYR